MGWRRAVVVALVLAGAGLFVSSVQGLTRLDARLAESDRQRDAVMQERRAADPPHCPLEDERRRL